MGSYGWTSAQVAEAGLADRAVGTSPRARKPSDDLQQAENQARYHRTKAQVDATLSALLSQLEREQLPAPILESKFAESLGRRFSFDLAWSAWRLAVEIEGGAHRTRERFRSDMVKYNLALVFGWRVLRVTPTQARSGMAARLIAALFRGDDGAALEVAQEKP